MAKPSDANGVRFTGHTAWPAVQQQLDKLGKRDPDALRKPLSVNFGGDLYLLKGKSGLKGVFERLGAWLSARAAVGALTRWAKEQFPQLDSKAARQLVKQHAPDGRLTGQSLKTLLEDLVKDRRIHRSPSVNHLWVGGSKLGQGGGGVVYQAMGVDGRDGYAVKAPGDEKIGPTAAEVAMHQKLMTDPPHPNVLQLVDSFVDDKGALLVVTEKMEGSVTEKLKSPGFMQLRFPALAHKEKHEWLMHMARGLAHMHAQGIAHGDVKLDNFLVRGRVAKVADFDTAWEVKPGQHWGGSTTKKFSSPEMQGDATQVGKPSDVFQLGLATLQLFNAWPNCLDADGAVAVNAPGVLDLDDAKRIQAWKDSGVSPGKLKPPELFELVMEMLHPSPDQRPTMAQAQARLEALHAQLPKPASAPEGASS